MAKKEESKTGPSEEEKAKAEAKVKAEAKIRAKAVATRSKGAFDAKDWMDEELKKEGRENEIK